MAKLDIKVVAMAVIILVAIGLLGYFILNKDDAPTGTTQTTQQGSQNVIETSAFKITAPEGATNDSAFADETGAISFDVDRSYGTMSVEIFTSSLQTTSTQETGTVTEEVVEIAGTEAERKDIDYVLTVNGPSDEPVIRYSILFDGINKPSETKKTKITINLLSTNDVPNENLDAFKQDAQDMLDSLVIK